jgi:hypothetical protein
VAKIGEFQPSTTQITLSFEKCYFPTVRFAAKPTMGFAVLDESAQHQPHQPHQQQPLIPLQQLRKASGPGEERYVDKENMQSAAVARERERAEFEHSLERGELRCTPSEQLDRWIDYIKWSQRAGCDKADVLRLLERCTETFKADRSLRSQRKYLRVWINYADMCPDKEGVFEFMWANKIGVTHALYFEAVSAMHETGEGTLFGESDLKRAMKMLAVGIKMQADPVERLHTRKKELKRRTLRRLQKEREQRGHRMHAPMQSVEEEVPEAALAVASPKPEVVEPEPESESSDKPSEPEPEPGLPVVAESLPEPILAQQQTLKVFDVTCDGCYAECSNASWRIEQADEDLCLSCYADRQNGDEKSRASVRDAVRQKDGQPIVAPEVLCRNSGKQATVNVKPAPKKAKGAGRKPLAAKKIAANKKEPQGEQLKKETNLKAAPGPIGNDDDDTTDGGADGPEPWVGTKKAKARRRKKLYKPTFDGEAPAAEDGGFSLFTDKNGRDCR